VGRKCESDEDRYRLLARILRDGKLRASGTPGAREDTATVLSVIGNRKISDETAIRGQIVCFCDIPTESMGPHMGKYSHFGLSFLKPFLVAKGANPVFYVVRDAVLPGIKVIPTGSGSVEQRGGMTRAELMDQVHKEAMALSTLTREMTLVASDNQHLQGLLLRVEYVRRLIYENVLTCIKPFDSTEPEESKRNFYMEREWRVYGDVLFQMADVRRVILPASFAERFLSGFPGFPGDVTRVDPGPACK
jgi:hypothetical protein